MERERKITISKEQLEVQRALARDRQTRRQARKKILASAEYQSLDNDGKQKYLESKLRQLNDIRDTKGISGKFSHELLLRSTN